MIKSCSRCCVEHKCGGRYRCEFYCSTLGIYETEDDEEYIEKGREEFRAEWFTYTELFYD